MGRLWQKLLLMKANAIFEYIPVEALIFQSQIKLAEVIL
jgi:hypothetical protein